MFKNFTCMGLYTDPVEELLERKIMNFREEHYGIQEIHRSSLTISNFEVDGVHYVYIGVTCEFK